MKAARFHRPGEPLRIEEVPDPELVPGAAIAKTLSAFVPPYFAEMIDGRASYPLPPLPFTPGMDTIGEIVAVADDVSGLEVGDKVFCDHFYNAVNVGGRAESCYVGAFGKGAASRRILARWRDGSFAQKLMLPAECFTPLGAASLIDPALLVRLGWFGTCYGAVLRSHFRPGHTVVINAATGLVGTAGVLLMLAMGAGKVVACGRRRRLLEELAQVEPRRVVAVPLPGSGEDAGTIRDAAGGGADLLIDAVGDIADPGPTGNALEALRPFGNALLVGGCTGDLSINYKWMLDRQITILGSSWYPRQGSVEMLDMIGAGVLNVEVLRARRFPLDAANEAVRWAETGSGGLLHAALVP